MNIEDEKRRFTELLRAAYEARRLEVAQYGEPPVLALDTDPTHVYIPGHTLEKCGYDYDDSNGFFWGMLCPVLKAAGVLTDYESFSPFSASSLLESSFEYPGLRNKARSLVFKLPEQYHYTPRSKYWNVTESLSLYDKEQWMMKIGSRIGKTIPEIISELEAAEREMTAFEVAHKGDATHLFVVNPERLTEKMKVAESERATKGGSETDSTYWITKKNGSYYFRGRLIHFKNPNAQYVIAFETVFSILPHGGDVTYPEIQDQHKKLSQRAVQRALTGGSASFFQHVKSVERTPAHGIPLFEASPDGKKLTFHNSK